MQAEKPNGSITPKTSEQFSGFSLIGSAASFFYASRRLREAQQAAKESAPASWQAIATADQAIALGAEIIAKSKAAIKATDAEIAYSQALRK